MALTPDRVLAVKAASDAIEAAGHGNKQRVASQEAGRLGCDVKTLYRQIKEAGFGKERKQRSDAGQCAISRAEAMTVMTLKVQAQRANGKDIMSIETAAELARENGLAALGKVDMESGEIVPVTTTTIARAIREYGLDLKTVNKPKPHVRMRSLHPNHVWQIDASVCVLFYLDNGGLGVMEADEFYKNKPESFQKRFKAMVIRYSATDHYTGTIFVRYYLGAESAAMVAEFFIDAIQAKSNDQEPFHGVPVILLLDPGSANGAHMFKNLCRLLQVRLLIHKAKNPRAKGQVENSHNLIECGFESRLVALVINTLDELNLHGGRWMRHFNGTKPHRRHGHTRYGLWQTIRREQLRIAPPVDVCRELLTTKPVERTVNGDLTVQFGEFYSVKHIPHLNIGGKVMVATNPYRPGSIIVIDQDEHGNDQHWVCETKDKDAAGFGMDSPVFGEGYKSVADTPAARDRKEMDRLAYGTDEKLAVDAARRKKKPAYGGLDVTEYLERQTPAAYMARPGTELEVASPVATGIDGDSLVRPGGFSIEVRTLNLVQLASRLAGAMPGEWTPGHYQQLVAWYPGGALESEVGAIVDRLRGFTEPPRLRAVGGA